MHPWDPAAKHQAHDWAAHGGVPAQASPFFDALVFKKVKQRMGGRVRAIVSGAAPLARHVGTLLCPCLPIDCTIHHCSLNDGCHPALQAHEMLEWAILRQCIIMTREDCTTLAHFSQCLVLQCI